METVSLLSGRTTSPPHEASILTNFTFRPQEPPLNIYVVLTALANYDRRKVSQDPHMPLYPKHSCAVMDEWNTMATLSWTPVRGPKIKLLMVGA